MSAGFLLHAPVPFPVSLTLSMLRQRLNLSVVALLTPLAAPVAANATDLNLSGVNHYALADEQVTSISQFADVTPTDWA